MGYCVNCGAHEQAGENWDHPGLCHTCGDELGY